MEISFDLSFIERFATLSPFLIIWEIFIRGGWVFFLIVILRGGWWIWLNWRRNAYDNKRKFFILTMDIPKANEQSPKAVENIFSHLIGARGIGTRWDQWWKGKTQETFSFEIISREGHIQFLIRANVNLRDLVEASIYSQYPDAQITEIEDYTTAVAQYFPNPTYQMWGAELILSKADAYPIRTYPQFEDKLAGEFKDPLATILEDFSRLKNGEQAWYQIILTPIPQKIWPERGQKIINKIIGRKVALQKNWLDHLSDFPLKIINFIVDILTPGPPPVSQEKEDLMKSSMIMLPPNEKAIVEAIGMKIGKVGFKVKIRFIYAAKREVFFPPRVVQGFFGSINQFSLIDMNSFRPATKYWTDARYGFATYRLNRRRRRLMRAYRVRSNERGAGAGFILNTEELASIWHFPVFQVKAPQVKKTEFKRAEPPVTLPMVG